METIYEKIKKTLPDEARISFRKSDIEKVLGLPPGKFTSPGIILPLFISVLFTILFYMVLPLTKCKLLIDMFTMRGIVPYLIVISGFWSMGILYIKYLKLLVQEKSLTVDIIPENEPGFVITPVSVAQVLDKIQKEVDSYKDFILTRRVYYALVNLKNIGNITDVDKILTSQADHDEAMVDSSYTVVRGLIWAIPVLGFIGTVLGLSSALGNFGGVLSNAENMDNLKQALQAVTGGLSTAFETTLEGLVAALSVHMLMISVQRREELFLDECKDYCQKNIVSRLRIDSVN